MPLSEHEQRLLDQIERALYDEDPKFASTVRSTDLRTHMRRRLVRAALLFVIGLVLLPVGVVIDQFAIGILGFLVMIGAMIMAMSAYRRLGTSPQPTAGSPGFPAGGRDELGERRQRRQRAPRPQAQGGFRQRIEERWQRRMDERGNGDR